jgi:hypothetical protein
MMCGLKRQMVAHSLVCFTNLNGLFPPLNDHTSLRCLLLCNFR